MSLPLAITCGDPAGIGPELIAKVLQKNPELELVPIGPEEWLSSLKGGLKGHIAGKAHDAPSAGKPTAAGAKIALEALEEAAHGCLEGRYRGAITAPINKYWMQETHWGFPGQTEFFQNRFGGEASMVMVGRQLCVLLATGHIPFCEVPKALSKAKLLRSIENGIQLIRKLHPELNAPRIGVCGLNPHAGEQGLLGSEEKRIDGLLEEFQEKYPGLSKTQPADTLFHRQIQGAYELIIALYHDQGLIPIKTLEFEHAVNLTFGLPYIRTSPDHGTAYELAGKSIASTQSLEHAIELAQKLSP